MGKTSTKHEDEDAQIVKLLAKFETGASDIVVNAFTEGYILGKQHAEKALGVSHEN